MNDKGEKTEKYALKHELYSTILNVTSTIEFGYNEDEAGEIIYSIVLK